MTIAIYPGSFNPWHKGHQSVLDKALEIFDQVIVAKYKPDSFITISDTKAKSGILNIQFNCLLPKLIQEWDGEINAVIRGLRNGNDLQYEQNMQYWYEDLGLKIPIIYLICDREHVHISSSAIRDLERFNV